MVLNAAQKAVLAKMPKEKQKEILKREKEKDRKKKKREEDEDAEEEIIRELFRERDKYKNMVDNKDEEISNLKFSVNLYWYFCVVYSGIIGASIYNIYYDYKHFIKIPREGLNPGDTYTFTMPGP